MLDTKFIKIRESLFFIIIIFLLEYHGLGIQGMYRIIVRISGQMRGITIHLSDNMHLIIKFINL